MLAVADQFASSPIDGVGLYLYGRNPDGQKVSSYTICQEPRWERAAFADQIPDFRRLVSLPGFRESFFVSYRAPHKRVDWTDDAGWATIAHNMGVLAALAKECGVKGLSVDHEDYRRQSQYVRLDGDPPYGECRRLARQRGREVFGAAFRAHPEVVILSFWILTEDRSYYTVSDPDALRKAKQDLWPDFVAGILDVLPPTARLVEGDEHAYRYAHLNRDFRDGVANARRMGRALMPSELRTKYLARVEQGFGQYLDAYVNSFDPAKRALWSLGPEGGSRVEHFRRNLVEATALVAEYVWFWGERNPWVRWPENMRPHKKIRYDRTWNDELPGLHEMMAVTKAEDRGEWERFARLRKAGTLSRPGGRRCEVRHMAVVNRPVRQALGAEGDVPAGGRRPDGGVRRQRMLHSGKGVGRGGWRALRDCRAGPGREARRTSRLAGSSGRLERRAPSTAGVRRGDARRLARGACAGDGAAGRGTFRHYARRATAARRTHRIP